MFKLFGCPLHLTAYIYECSVFNYVTVSCGHIMRVLLLSLSTVECRSVYARTTTNMKTLTTATAMQTQCGTACRMLCTVAAVAFDDAKQPPALLHAICLLQTVGFIAFHSLNLVRTQTLEEVALARNMALVSFVFARLLRVVAR